MALTQEPSTYTDMKLKPLDLVADCDKDFLGHVRDARASGRGQRVAGDLLDDLG